MGKAIILNGGGGMDQDDLNTTPADVLDGKVFGGSGSDEPQTGTMPINPSPTSSLNCGQSKTIPAGFNPGGAVTANSLASQTSATAVASDVSAGKTAIVNGIRIVGNMPNNGNVTSFLNCGQSHTIARGQHGGAGNVTANSLESQTRGNAGSPHILRGHNAWSNGLNMHGSIDSLHGHTLTPTNWQQVISSNGKYMTGDVIIQAVSNLVPQNIRSGVQVGNVVGTLNDYSHLAAGQVVFRNGIFSGLMAEGMQSPNRLSYVYYPRILDGAIDMSISPTNDTTWHGQRFISKKTIHLGTFNRLVVKYDSSMSNGHDVEFVVEVYSKNYTWGSNKWSMSYYTAEFTTLARRIKKISWKQRNAAIEVDISGINEQCFIGISTRDTYDRRRFVLSKVNEIELIN